MQRTDIIVERFKRGDYYIDIYQYEDGYCEAFLARKNHGIPILMFGEDCADYDEFCDLVEENVAEYIDIYEENYR